MNWKFWTWFKRPAAPALSVDLFDPNWPEKRRLLLARLANTPPNDPLINGVLALLDQSLLAQIRRCEDPRHDDSQCRSIVNSIGLLVGLRADLETKWREQLAKKASAEAKRE